MISRLSGQIAAVGSDHLVVQVGGVGFRVHVPASVLSRVDGVGRPVELVTHLHVRENELTLYGFLTEEELALFELLLGVSGVGPKDRKSSPFWAPSHQRRSVRRWRGMNRTS